VQETIGFNFKDKASAIVPLSPFRQVDLAAVMRFVLPLDREGSEIVFAQ
jgi:hypothetical protein